MMQPYVASVAKINGYIIFQQGESCERRRNLIRAADRDDHRGAGPAAGEHDLTLFPSLLSRLLFPATTRLLLPAAASLLRGGAVPARAATARQATGLTRERWRTAPAAVAGAGGGWGSTSCFGRSGRGPTRRCGWGGTGRGARRWR